MVGLLTAMFPLVQSVVPGVELDQVYESAPNAVYVYVSPAQITGVNELIPIVGLGMILNKSVFVVTQIPFDPSRVAVAIPVGTKGGPVLIGISVLFGLVLVNWFGVNSV